LLFFGPLWVKMNARIYDFNPALTVPREETSMSACKHPHVQIVSREEDAEFVECLDCREVFESSEFKDMTIEETNLNQET
jgi:hypothetical protein